MSVHEDKSKKKVRATIERAENGFTVECFYENDDNKDGPFGETKRFIFDTIEEVSKALPGLFSVAEAESPDEDEESLEKRKKKINESHNSDHKDD